MQSRHFYLHEWHNISFQNRLTRLLQSNSSPSLHDAVLSSVPVPVSSTTTTFALMTKPMFSEPPHSTFTVKQLAEFAHVTFALNRTIPVRPYLPPVNTKICRNVSPGQYFRPAGCCRREADSPLCHVRSGRKTMSYVSMPRLARSTNLPRFVTRCSGANIRFRTTSLDIHRVTTSRMFRMQP